MKRMISMVIVVLFLCVSLSYAQGGPDGNDRKGKYTYKKVYKKCAKRGGVKSIVPINSPGDKTMKEWKRIFVEKDFGCFECSEEWDALSDKDKNNIYAYLYKYAKDSPTPAKCQ